MGILPSCSTTIIWMLLMDVNKTLREKAIWELQKNALCCLEQNLKATPHKTAAVQPPALISQTIQIRQKHCHSH